MRFRTAAIVWVLIFFGVGGVCAVKAAEKTARKRRPGVFELLQRYTATQNKLKSYIVEIETTAYDVVRPIDGVVKTESVSYSQIRTDGKRFYVNERQPTDLLKPKTVVIPNDRWSRTWIWDGKTYFSYEHYSKGYARRYRQEYPGQVQKAQTGQKAQPKPEAVKGVFSSVRIFGNPGDAKVRRMISQRRPGRLDDVLNVGLGRIDLVFRLARKISVRDEMETVRGSKCYVVDAIVPKGKNRFKYKIWLDPKHDYHVAKAVVWMQRGKYLSCDNVRFKRIDGVWVPVEKDIERKREKPLDGKNMEKLHVKCTRVVLKPDHGALRSFVPKPRQGSTVFVRGVRGLGGKRTYKWNKGQVVDSKGQKVDYKRERKKPQANPQKKKK